MEYNKLIIIRLKNWMDRPLSDYGKI